jgi:hypothetical protein
MAYMGSVVIESYFRKNGQRYFKKFSVMSEGEPIRLGFNTRAEAEKWAYLAGYDLPFMT